MATPIFVEGITHGISIMVEADQTDAVTLYIFKDGSGTVNVRPPAHDQDVSIFLVPGTALSVIATCKALKKGFTIKAWVQAGEPTKFYVLLV